MKKITRSLLICLLAAFLCPLFFSRPVFADATGCMAVNVYLREYGTDEQISDTSVYAKLKGNVYENGKLVRTVFLNNNGILCMENEPESTYMRFIIGEDYSFSSAYWGTTTLTLGNTYEFELVVPDGYAADLYEVRTYHVPSGTWKTENDRLIFTYTKELQQGVFSEGEGCEFTNYYHYRDANTPKPVVKPTKTPFTLQDTSYTFSARKLSFYLLKSSGPDAPITFKSSNSSVVSVNMDGKVTLGKPGAATITITCPETSEYIKLTKTVTFKILPKTTSSIKASAKKKTVKISWKKDNDVTGYQINMAKNKSFTKGKKTYTVKSYKTTSKKLKKMKKGTYYIKIRSYKKTSLGNLYSSYSKVIRFRIK